MTNQEYINWDIISALADDEETRSSILATFIESYEADLAKLQDAIADSNHGELVFISHTIKGASSNFCHKFIVEEITKIEQQIKNASSSDYKERSLRLFEITKQTLQN